MPPRKRTRDDEGPVATLPTPHVFVGFFRALNVSGCNVIRMAALTEVLRSCGALRCQTYIQSGNVAFTIPADMTALAFASNVMRVLAEEHAIVNSAFVVRSLESLETIIARCPVSKSPSSSASISWHGHDGELQAKYLLCYLFSEACVPSKRGAARDKLQTTGKLTTECILEQTSPDGDDKSKCFSCSELFVYFSDGVGKTKLSIDVLKKCFGVAVAPTGRNWTTLCTMRDIGKSLVAASSS